MQSLFEESRDYINNFLQTTQLDVASVKSVNDLLAKYIDISITSNDDDKLFRLLAIEKKEPDKKRPKTVQLFNFGLTKKEKFCQDYPEPMIDAHKAKFIIFTKYFQIQKKFAEIISLKEDVVTCTNEYPYFLQ